MRGSKVNLVLADQKYPSHGCGSERQFAPSDGRRELQQPLAQPMLRSVAQYYSMLVSASLSKCQESARHRVIDSSCLLYFI
eukprot:6095385-Amphidinium_carterae.1